jgi:D-serine deaminase-like pyridoxal phosphate-dependent protein
MDVDYQRYSKAIAGETLPVALVDLDALEQNARAIFEAAQGKPVRLATKSVRCVELLRFITRLGARGLMTYSAEETRWLWSLGFTDLLLAYPTMHPGALADTGAIAVVDCVEHLEALSLSAQKRGVLIDVDLAYRFFGRGHLGVRRSPLRTPEQVVALAQKIRPPLEFMGVLAYEAQLAGLPDRGAALLLKALSRPEVARRRQQIADALRAAGLEPRIFNGGGTGNLSQEPALTELTAGSGFLCSHLFDGIRGLALRPAAFFALEASRAPAPGIVTCSGGGFVASGAASKDRLPKPWLPRGLSLLDLEGAGEVQTPVRLNGASMKPGAPIFFRHAKAGELAEHFDEYLLLRGDRVEARARTYRGEGHAFLG